MYLLPVFVLVPCVFFCTVLYSCRAYTIAQSIRVMYVLPVLYSCRAVVVPLHRVLYLRRATVSTGNVRFTRFVLGPCCGCTIAPCVGNVPLTRFYTRAVRVLLHSASTDRVLIGRVCTRAVAVPLHGMYRACTVISFHSCWTSSLLKGSAISFPRPWSRICVPTL